MFKYKIAISKNFLIAICCISFILFAIGSVNAIDLNENNSNFDSQTIGITVNGNYGLNAIDNHYTYGSRICSDLWSGGNNTYEFN